MPLFETLKDGFESDQLATLWISSFGTISVTGGRLRCTSNTSYNAAGSAFAYTLDESYVLVKAYPAAQNSATVQAITEMLVKSSVDGTDAGFSYNAVDGNLHLMSRVDFFDASEVSITYSETTHRWWRLRIVSGNMLWDTSEDGLTWTNRRTATAPAWSTTETELYVLLLAHRNDGTTNFSEFDVFNLTPITGTLAATLPALSGAIAGESTVRGPLAGTLPALTGSFSGEQTVRGTVAGQLPALTATIAGKVTAEGTLNGTFPALAGSATGTVTASGTLSAQLPALTGSATGTATVAGSLNGQLPALTGSAAGVITATGVLAGQLPALTGTAAGTLAVQGTLAGSLPALIGSIQGELDAVTGILGGTLPALTGALEGRITARGTLVANLPGLTATFAGTVSQDVAGTLTAVLPALRGAFTGISGQGDPLPPVVALITTSGRLSATLTPSGQLSATMTRGE